jgi:hypothetical protein
MVTDHLFMRKPIQFVKNNSEQFVKWEIITTLQKIIKTIKPTIAFIILITSAGAMIVGAIINVMLDYHFNY